MHVCDLCCVPMLSVPPYFVLFFFKQKTAYEMRISDWSSDVCSSDLHPGEDRQGARRALPDPTGPVGQAQRSLADALRRHEADRKSVVSGKSVSVRVDLGGRRIIKKQKNHKSYKHINIHTYD